MARLLALPLLIALAVALTGCQLGLGEKRQSTARLGMVIVEDFEADLAAIGYFDSSDSDYSSIDMAIGSTRTVVDDDGTVLERKDLVELQLGFAEYGQLDALEVAGGYRHYLEGERFLPYVSVYGVTTTLDDVGGFSYGTQLGLRLGGGVQWLFNERAFLDLGLDYTTSLLSAESDFDGGLMSTIDTDLEGIALRIAIGLYF